MSKGTNDWSHNVGESQYYYAEWKKLKGLHSDWFNLYSILESDRKWISGCLGKERGKEGEITRRH